MNESYGMLALGLLNGGLDILPSGRLPRKGDENIYFYRYNASTCSVLAGPEKVNIALIVTGGTFDKEYNELSGSLYFKRTHVREMLELGRCRLSVRLEIVMLKDSLEITGADRGAILAACRKSPESKIIITHGTDTMEHTARLLGPALASSDKTVVLTGAMVPYRFGSSDGMFNLGCAIGLVQALLPGVYVGMNGQYFGWQHVTKNRQKGYFHSIKTRRSSKKHQKRNAS